MNLHVLSFYKNKEVDNNGITAFILTIQKERTANNNFIVVGLIYKKLLILRQAEV